jgi:hypothetical protein
VRHPAADERRDGRLTETARRRWLVNQDRSDPMFCRPMQALAEVAGLLAQNNLVIKVQTSRSTAPPRPTTSAKAATSAESSS